MSSCTRHISAIILALSFCAFINTEAKASHFEICNHSALSGTMSIAMAYREGGPSSTLVSSGWWNIGYFKCQIVLTGTVANKEILLTVDFYPKRGRGGQLIGSKYLCVHPKNGFGFRNASRCSQALINQGYRDRGFGPVVPPWEPYTIYLKADFGGNPYLSRRASLDDEWPNIFALDEPNQDGWALAEAFAFSLPGKDGPLYLTAGFTDDGNQFLRILAEGSDEPLFYREHAALTHDDLEAFYDAAYKQVDSSQAVHNDSENKVLVFTQTEDQAP